MRRGFAAPFALVGIVLLLLVAGGAYYLGKSGPSAPASPPSATIVPTTAPIDQTANWKRFEGKVYSFNYPPDWIAQENQDTYLGDVAKITNQSKSLVLNVSTNQLPYGIEAPKTYETHDLTLTIEGKTYTAKEIVFSWGGNNTTVSQGNAVVDYLFRKNGKNFHILFGTGYPAGEDRFSSLNDYTANKSVFSDILSTFKFANEIQE